MWLNDASARNADEAGPNAFTRAVEAASALTVAAVFVARRGVQRIFARLTDSRSSSTPNSGETVAAYARYAEALGRITSPWTTSTESQWVQPPLDAARSEAYFASDATKAWRPLEIAHLVYDEQQNIWRDDDPSMSEGDTDDQAHQ